MRAEVAMQQRPAKVMRTSQPSCGAFEDDVILAMRRGRYAVQEHPTADKMVTTRRSTRMETSTEVTYTTTSTTTTKTKKVGVSEKSHPMMYVVFVSLLLDLLAFTMILPLLPSLMDHYRQRDDSGLFQWLLRQVHFCQNLLGVPDRYNSVLFGGFLGSLFSFLQFVASPIVGGFSDRFGRKPALLGCLVGIAGSYVLWVFSSNFALFVLARVFGGISKGNVSLSLAVIADVASDATRGKGMALVGIAFSVGFVLGPLVGAMFARWSHGREGTDWYMAPAALALTLSLLDLVFVALRFKETLPKAKRAPSVASSVSQAVAYINPVDLFQFSAVRGLKPRDASQLQLIGRSYFLYLFLYSGLEFTLTFLTHHAFGYSPMEQGKMFFCIGLVMALLQGGFVRRVPPHRTHATARLGLLLTVPSFLSVGLAASTYFPDYKTALLYTGLFLFAVSTSMTVPCLSTLISQFGADHQKGKVMGIFRSLGALARALGPIVASVAYWSLGSSLTYFLGGIVLLVPWRMLK